MRYNDLPERWKAKLQQHVATTRGGEFRGLSASDFSSNSVAITFEDGSQVEFKYAFVIQALEMREVGVFTEHCGYHIFPLYDGLDLRINEY
ncbi:hypothetical protein FNT36_06410 [Hymenobacter setariae]|uniref:Uncharacterized protein n=1 Tax=Hymenobacter setariae TaxID=2594794 RepID=A0A558C4L3_9BACT|nr:hypothetical protein [Hymenobacter setariae]TVT43714.1 hypothetical protein FNT36_06410 [Hymenobacter setariae]